MRHAHNTIILGALLLLAFFFCSCGADRAQVAADARAGLAAAAPHADPIGQAILAGVDARLPAVADVPSAEWPTPAMTPAAIEADPPKYQQTAPPEPKGGWLKVAGIATAVGSVLLFTIGRIAPAVPGLGPAVGMLANTAWAMLAHKDQKAADAARSVVQTYAPVVEASLTMAKKNGVALPDELTDAVSLLAKT